MPGFSDTFVSPQYGDSSSGIGNIIQSSSCNTASAAANCPSTDPAGLGQLRGATIAAGETAAQLNSFFETIAALDRKVPIVVAAPNEKATLAKANPGTPSLINAPSPPSLERELGDAVSLARRAIDGAVSFGSGAPAATADLSNTEGSLPNSGAVLQPALKPSLAPLPTEGPGWSDGAELYASVSGAIPPSRSGSAATDLSQAPAQGFGHTFSESSTTDDPADYFSRTPVEDSIFVIVHTRYTKKAESWAKTEAR